jgi:hypothetical protein
MAKMTAAQAIASDDWADYPAIAAALDQLDKATNPQERGAAQDALRRAELERALALGFDDMWSDWEREEAHNLGLIKGD